MENKQDYKSGLLQRVSTAFARPKVFGTSLAASVLAGVIAAGLIFSSIKPKEQKEPKREDYKGDITIGIPYHPRGGRLIDIDGDERVDAILSPEHRLVEYLAEGYETKVGQMANVTPDTRKMTSEFREKASQIMKATHDLQFLFEQDKYNQKKR